MRVYYLVLVSPTEEIESALPHVGPILHAVKQSLEHAPGQRTRPKTIRHDSRMLFLSPKSLGDQLLSLVKLAVARVEVKEEKRLLHGDSAMASSRPARAMRCSKSRLLKASCIRRLVLTETALSHALSKISLLGSVMSAKPQYELPGLCASVASDTSAGDV